MNLLLLIGIVGAELRVAPCSAVRETGQTRSSAPTNERLIVA